MNDDSIARARERIIKAMTPSLRRPSDPRVSEAMATFNSVDPQLQDLFWGSDNELADFIAATLPTEEIEFPDFGPPPTASERQTLEREIFLEQMGIGETNTPIDQTNWLRAHAVWSEPVVSDQEIADNVLAIARMAAHDPAAAEVLVKHNPTKCATSGLQSKFIRRLAQCAEEVDADPALTRFLKSYSVGDREGMRVAAREFAKPGMR